MYVICMQELYVIVEKNYSRVQILHFCKKKTSRFTIFLCGGNSVKSVACRKNDKYEVLPHGYLRGSIRQCHLMWRVFLLFCTYVSHLFVSSGWYNGSGAVLR